MGQKVINQTRNTVVVDHLEVADTYLKRLVGLLGRKGLEQGRGLWIVPCNDIHSFFMQFEFDAVFLDKEHRVLYTVERMKPWRISKIVRGGRIVLELPPDTVAETQTDVGDQFILQVAE